MDTFNPQDTSLCADASPMELVIAGLTHDVRGALSGIRLQARSAADALVEGDTADAHHSLARIDRIVCSISTLCDDLLECKRRDVGTATLKTSRFELGETVRTCLTAQFPASQRRKCALELALAPEVWICSHASSIERILVNLVGNAVRHGAGGQIRVGVTSDGRSASITVRDSGRGIARDVLDRARAPYERGDSADAAFESYGLGLWIVTSLARSLGGALGFDSELGVGTRVSLRLPLAPSETFHERAARALV